MNSICIDSCILGTTSHLHCSSGTYKWVKSVPIGTWHLSGKIKTGNCLDTLLTLHGKQINFEPPFPFIKALETCRVTTAAIPWQKVMPRDAHHAFMRGIITAAEESISSLDRDYLEGLWMAGEAVLMSLRPAHVDARLWQSLNDKKVGNWRVVKTFKPNSKGQCSAVSYNRFGTRTGRLTIESGPSILTLKRDYRNILRSQWGDDGCIAYIDFCNLEARILLYESGGRCEPTDLYSYINSEVFQGSMDRDDIKGAVISELYGQSKRALGLRLKLTGKKLNNFTSRVKHYFKTEKLLARVKNEFVSKGFITNRYGRRVEITEFLDRIFINSYTQSTGVDVTMLGFKQIIDQVSDHRCEPIFLLHDAILFDCHKDDLKYLEKVSRVTVKGYVQSFPLSMHLLDCTLPLEENTLK